MHKDAPLIIAPKMHTTLISIPSPDVLAAILKLEKQCFPQSWQYPDAEEYYSEKLKDSFSVNICLYVEESIVGYALAQPLGVVLPDLLPHDPQLVANSKMMYFETIQVLADFQRMGGGQRLNEHVMLECARRGFSAIALHARCVNHANLLVRHNYGSRIAKTRPIANWFWGGGEPYEYIEILL